MLPAMQKAKETDPVPRRLAFTLRDAKLATQVVVDAGLGIRRIEFQPEKIVFEIGESIEIGSADLDRELEEFKARHGQG